MKERREASVDFLPRLFYEALEQTGWRADAQTLAARVERLRLGLPAEDEFSVLLAWLGRCRLVHKLDQLQAPPKSKEYYRVPDLLVVFEHADRALPVLIEVKSKMGKPKVDDKLSWRADYYEGLQRYGQAVGLPVLVAWKYGGLWALFELRHFERPNVNYKISLETALKQNLLGVLAGDFAFVLRSGVGFHLRATKEERLSVTEDTEESSETWRLRIEDAYFTKANGKRTSKLGRGLWPLFLASPLEELCEVTDTHILQSFVVPREGPMQWTHGALSILLGLRTEGESPVRWREVLQKYSIPTEAAVLRQAAQDGIEAEVVRYVFDQVPQEQPGFLASEATHS
jgi:hypothetical protein